MQLYVCIRLCLHVLVLNWQWQTCLFTFMLHGISMRRQFTVYYILNTCVVASFTIASVSWLARIVRRVRLHNICCRSQGLRCFTACWWLTSLYVSFMDWSVSQRPGLANAAECCFFTVLSCLRGGIIWTLRIVSFHETRNVSMSEHRMGDHSLCLFLNSSKNSALKMDHYYVIPHAPQSTIHDY
jgi:hypothetical protein